MENIIIIAVILLILGAAAGYVYKAKKSGKKCIGCPDGCSCSSRSDGNKSSSGGSCCNCRDK